MTTPTDDDWEPSGLVRLADSLAAGVIRPPDPDAASTGNQPRGFVWNPGIVAIGWATVDLERTAAELPDLDFDFAPGDEALGARALIAHLGTIALVLLEASTEGRLAGTLARNGEGIAVTYLVSRGLPPAGEPRMTPLGRPGRLVDPTQRWGPFVVVVD